ncbi:hypothetical protein [Nannocystis punicea]|uniref:Uncharacterized protein n=1 Tax=Nannocystis punicea TaxID=2995304 RepID=A0ABY7H8F8_9BACT|nr:hypothetical protein [Nannocystis poenicansa]WAS95433.1 hypothetical protein O0S08_04670 [Nannocystis poenicansa]
MTAWAFWGDSLVEVMGDPALRALGQRRIYKRTRFALTYGPAGGFSLARRHTEWPHGQHAPTDHDDLPRPHDYRLKRGKLVITSEDLDEPLECTPNCVDQGLVDFMDRYLGTATPPELAARWITAHAGACEPDKPRKR